MGHADGAAVDVVGRAFSAERSAVVVWRAELHEAPPASTGDRVDDPVRAVAVLDDDPVGYRPPRAVGADGVTALLVETADRGHERSLRLLRRDGGELTELWAGTSADLPPHRSLAAAEGLVLLHATSTDPDAPPVERVVAVDPRSGRELDVPPLDQAGFRPATPVEAVVGVGGSVLLVQRSGEVDYRDVTEVRRTVSGTVEISGGGSLMDAVNTELGTDPTADFDLLGLAPVADDPTALVAALQSRSLGTTSVALVRADAGGNFGYVERFGLLHPPCGPDLFDSWRATGMTVAAVDNAYTWLCRAGEVSRGFPTVLRADAGALGSEGLVWPDDPSSHPVDLRFARDGGGSYTVLSRRRPTSIPIDLPAVLTEVRPTRAQTSDTGVRVDPPLLSAPDVGPLSPDARTFWLHHESGRRRPPLGYGTAAPTAEEAVDTASATAATATPKASPEEPVDPAEQAFIESADRWDLDLLPLPLPVEGWAHSDDGATVAVNTSSRRGRTRPYLMALQGGGSGVAPVEVEAPWDAVVEEACAVGTTAVLVGAAQDEPAVWSVRRTRDAQGTTTAVRRLDHLEREFRGGRLSACAGSTRGAVVAGVTAAGRSLVITATRELRPDARRLGEPCREPADVALGAGEIVVVTTSPCDRASAVVTALDPDLDEARDVTLPLPREAVTAVDLVRIDAASGLVAVVGHSDGWPRVIELERIEGAG